MTTRIASSRRTPAPRRHRRLAGEGGSLSAETAVLAPVFLLGIAALAIFGRAALIRSSVDEVAWAAARQASLARTPAAATDQATAGARNEMTAQALGCLGGPTVNVQPVGSTAGIRVTITCTLGPDQTWLPFTRDFTATAASAIDPWRGAP